MKLAEAQELLGDWASNTFVFADEIGNDAEAQSALLAEAIGSVGAIPDSDLDAWMADIQSQIVIYDGTGDATEFDNSGAVVIFDDGTEMTYDAYQAGGYEGGDDPFTGMAPIFEVIDPLAERRPVIGVDDMCKMEA